MLELISVDIVNSLRKIQDRYDMTGELAAGTVCNTPDKLEC